MHLDLTDKKPAVFTTELDGIRRSKVNVKGSDRYPFSSRIQKAASNPSPN
jgi:hypothetical protein